MLNRMIALMALIAAGPLLFVVMLLVYIDLGWPIFFVPQRAGLQGVPFRMLKFRTMNQRRDVNGELLPDVDRITRLGNFLRKSSIDEIPELVNVVLGHMLLIGPRPLPVEYMSKYSDVQKRRLLVRPGVTGLAQIKGRNSLSWRHKFKYDVFYVEHPSMRLNIFILFKTVLVLFDHKIVNRDTKETMKKFEG